jgi:hypothetical protein
MILHARELPLARTDLPAVPEGAFVDPNLMVLLFLLGFCLLYAGVLAADILFGLSGRAGGEGPS